MSEREVGWVSVKKVVEASGDHIELTLNVGSFKDALIVNIDAGDWSKMLSSPNLPVGAEVRFVPR
jgi:hypothetical protein